MQTRFLANVRSFAGRGSTRLHLGVFALLALLAILAWWHVWISGDPTTTITCACGDPSQELWLFAWIPYALSHTTNPLFTNLMEAGQGGVNVMWDANNLLASFLLSPVTVLFGPVASFNVAALIAPVLSGWCFFFAARRITRFAPGQVAGAVLYGFSPFIIWNSPYGHINLTWLFFPPLVFLLLHDLCLRPSRRPAVVGRWLGVLVVLQFFSATEVLVVTAVGVVIGGAIAVAFAPRSAWALRRRIGVAVAWAAAISIVLLAYPAWFAAEGPQHIVGSPWPSLNLPTRGVVASTILFENPTLRQANAVHEMFGYYGAVGPPLLFLGIGLVAFLAISTVVWHRSRLAWIMAGLGGIASLLTLGSVVVSAGIGNQELPTHQSPWWLAWRLLAHVPILEDLQPSRFAIIAGFAVAMLLTISADRWWQLATTLSAARRRLGPRAESKSRPAVWGVALSLALVGVLWTVADAYVLPFAVHHDAEPAWFVEDAPRLKAGTRVLVLPTDFLTVTNVMSWQAEEGLPFALEGGYALIPGLSSPLFTYSLVPRGAASVLDGFVAGRYEPLSLAGQVRDALKRWRVSMVIMNAEAPYPSMKAFFTDVFGQPPRRLSGLWVWTAGT